MNKKKKPVKEDKTKKHHVLDEEDEYLLYEMYDESDCSKCPFRAFCGR